MKQGKEMGEEMFRVFRQATSRIVLPLIAGAAVILVSGCETSSVYENRYARYYDACDQQAGQCYTRCLEWAEGSADRAQCQSDCTARVDRCFADISDRISRDEAMRYAYTPAPFYGRYGYWRPGYGYIYGPHGYPYSYYRYARPGYGYDYGYGYGRDYDRGRDHDRGRDYDRGRDHDRDGDRDRDRDGGRDDRGRDDRGGYPDHDRGRDDRGRDDGGRDGDNDRGKRPPRRSPPKLPPDSPPKTPLPQDIRPAPVGPGNQQPQVKPPSRD